MRASIHGFLCATFVVAVTACGGTSTAPGNDGLLFRGEAKLLDGFAFDTGPQPAIGPASVTLRLSGGGALTVTARGLVAGGKLDGAPGTGKVDIDAHVKLDGTLRVDSPVKKSSGDIPGLKDLDIAIKGSAAFDPFLEGVSVTAAIPETKLPDVPLGSVPGKLKLTVAAGSQLVSQYAGTCLTTSSGVTKYVGSATTSGKLVLEGTIVLELPAPLNREIAIPKIAVAIPSATSVVTFGDVATSGVADRAAGTCGSTPKPDSGVGDTNKPSEDAATPACSGEGFEPDALRDDARLLPVIRDCDNEAATVTGVLSSTADIDTLRFIGEDAFGCSVNPYAKITGAARVCIAPVCTVGETNFQGCAKGTREGTECCGTEVEANFNCTGTTKDNARVYLTVKPTTSTTACSSYSIRYHY